MVCRPIKYDWFPVHYSTVCASNATSNSAALETSHQRRKCWTQMTNFSCVNDFIFNSVEVIFLMENFNSSVKRDSMNKPNWAQLVINLLSR